MHFTDIYGYWSDRIILADWLIQASERRGDIGTLIYQLIIQGWALTRIGQAKQAEVLYMKAWKLQEYGKPERLSELAWRFAENKRAQKNYTEGFQWLEQAEKIADEIQNGYTKKRRKLSIINHRGQICYEAGDYKQAEELLEFGIKECQAIGWQRAIIWNQLILADVKLALGDSKETEKLLNVVLPIMERNKDRYGIAMCKRSFAYLEKHRGNTSQFYHWAYKALEDFEHFGVLHEADEMRKLIGEEQNH